MGMDPATIGMGLSAGSALLGSGKGAKSQNQSANAASGLYNQEAQTIQQLLQNYTSMAIPQVNQLFDWQSQQGPEIANYETQMGNSGISTVDGIMQRMGGVANPNAFASDLFTKNRESAMGATVANQAQTSGQALQAKESGISALTQPLGASLGGLQSIGNAYNQNAQSAGNPWSSGIGGLAQFLTQGNFGGSGGGGGAPSPYSWAGGNY